MESTTDIRSMSCRPAARLGDGLRVLRTLAADGLAPRVTVALTGHDDSDTVQRCLDAGCAAVLGKPVPIRELLRRMAEWTNG